MINKYVCKYLACKNGNENPIWIWNNSLLMWYFHTFQKIIYMCLFSDCDINIYPISNAITSFFYCVFNLIIKMLIDITSSCFFFQGHHLQQLESLRLSFTRFLQLIISLFMVYIHIIYCFNRHYLWDLSEQRLSETSLL